MGESKRRRKNFAQDNPACCYCGGERPFATRDHMPPAILFDKKSRPDGLVLPACNDCNHKTSRSEQVVALITRMHPDSEASHNNNEFAELIRAVSNNHPGLLESLMPSTREVRRFMRKIGLQPGVDGSPSEIPLLKGSSELVDEHFDVFARKLACALHYNHTKRIIPRSGAIFYRWFSNIEFMDGRFPDALLEEMGPPHTLKQGEWHVAEQFAYRYQVSNDLGLGKYFCKFRSSFGLFIGVNCEPSEDFLKDNDFPMHHPLGPW